MARIAFLVAVSLLDRLGHGPRRPAGRAGRDGCPRCCRSRSCCRRSTPPPTAHPPTALPSTDYACRALSWRHRRRGRVPLRTESLPVEVDLLAFDASVHGADSTSFIGCTGCHAPANYRFPHPPPAAGTLREYAILQSQNCVNCHDPHLTAHPGPEWSGGYDVAASASGLPVVCTDSHGDHHVQTADAWQMLATTTVCADCHINAGSILTDPGTLSQPHPSSGLFAQKQVNNDFCMGCHGPPDQTMTFPNGDEISISIDGEGFHASVHGDDNSWQALNCTDCHQDYSLPHPPLQAATARDYTIQQSELCARCHEPQHEGQMSSSHAQALAEGNKDAATCVDCHGSHYTQPPAEPRSRISETCRQCHSTIFDEYAESVHGASLLGDENPDVPTCIECHGVHAINDPTTALFRNRSPELCARLPRRRGDDVAP